MISGIEQIGNAPSTENLSMVDSSSSNNTFFQELEKVNAKQLTSEQLLQDFAVGKTNNIHHVMLALEDAKLSLYMLVQTRNKIIEGYQEILRMQV